MNAPERTLPRIGQATDKTQGVGARMPLIDGVDKVTGTARYTADLPAQGALVGRILRSPWAHAEILSVDISAALELPGVRGAIDFPLAGVAVALRRDGDLIGELRVACTGVSSRPEFIAGLDELVGKPLDDAALATMERHLKRGIQPMETTLASVPYRRRATPALAKRLVRRLWDEAGQGA